MIEEDFRKLHYPFLQNYCMLSIREVDKFLFLIHSPFKSPENFIENRVKREKKKEKGNKEKGGGIFRIFLKDFYQEKFKNERKIMCFYELE